MRQSLRRGQDVPGADGLESDEVDSIRKLYPFFSNAYYSALIQERDDPIWKQVIPSKAELEDPTYYMEDALGEDGDDSPVPHLTHRYPDRVLFTVTYTCAIYCRFCTRKRKVGKYPVPRWSEMEAVFEYLRGHPEVRDVLLSGGDPLLLSDQHLDRILSNLRAIPSIEVIRIGSKLPCVLPARITPELCDILRKYHPLYVNTHFNHPRELTAQAHAACTRLADAGVPLGCQTVLLKGVNDDPAVMKELMLGLLKMRVKPYYLYQADLVKGTHHFRTSIQTGLDIINHLQGNITGFAVPKFVIDAPGGGGKMTVAPNRLVNLDSEYATLVNYEGKVFKYPAQGSHETSIPDHALVATAIADYV